MKKITTSAEAHKLKLKAQKRIESGADVLAQNDAEQMNKSADEFLTPKSQPERGFGGEIVPPDERGLGGMMLTVKKDDATSIEASIERIELADKCDVYNLAFDAAEAAQTQNPMEQMLVHQMAAAHKHAMELLAKSAKQNDTNEMVRLTNSASRLMEVYQKAMLALNKIKKGGKQTVTVQHVTVSDNAQAIVNPNIDSGGLDG